MRRGLVHGLLAALLVTALLVPGHPGRSADFTGFFSDVPPGHPAFDAVNTLYLLGISEGDGVGRFYPDNPVTRAELVKLVLLARGMTIPPQCAGTFADVPCGAWYAAPVELGYRVAIVDGRDASQFAPLDPVTRQELFVILVRAMGAAYESRRQNWLTLRERLAGFADEAGLAEWARPSAAWLAAEGHLSAGEGPLRPGSPATRAEVAVLLHRALAPAYPAREVAVIDGLPVRYTEAREMRATKYATGEPGVGLWTYTSTRVRVGVVAVDPDVIALGTFMYVEGYGYAVAADIGGAIKGNRIDLFTKDLAEARRGFGVQNLQVYILD